MALAQEPSQIVVDPRQYLHFLYGEAGVGKTTWASQIPGHYFIHAEAGASGVSVFGSPVKNWEEFIGVCRELVAAIEQKFEGMRPITTIVIDSYDALYDLAGRYICEKESFLEKGKPERFDNIEDVPWGKGYKRCNNLILRTIRKLRSVGYGIVLLGHAKERIIQWRKQDLTAVGFNLPPGAAMAIEGECDVIGWATIEETIEKAPSGEVTSVEQGRYVYWQPTFLRTAKHRLKGFPERTLFKRDTSWTDYVEEFTKVLSANGISTESRTSNDGD